ncbi:DUF4214 domain-containing protein [Roseiterribacter gracilis]|uniref:DUF4214 domain-containing protein n=1 Tax=Roseiterribacter gracilis TaxID=2812848 RepID=UPI003B4284D2
MAFNFQVTLSDTNQIDATTRDLVLADINAALRYLGTFFTGRGTVDVVVTWVSQDADTLASAGPNGFYSLTNSGPASNVYTAITTYELLTGRDPNGADNDANVQINPANLNEFWFDPTPDDRTDLPPFGKVDFLSTILHELAHTFGFISFRNFDGSFDDNARAPFDLFTTNGGGTYDSEAVREVAGGPVALDTTHGEGSRWNHLTDRTDLLYYAANASSSRNYSLVDLAILHDAGMVSNTPGAGADIWFGSNGSDTIDGGAGNDQLFALEGDDRITGGSGNDVIDGGTGYDTVIFAATRASEVITGKASTSFTVSGTAGTDTVRHVEVLQFSDKTLFALTGTDATVARLYGAAFARAPDAAGLGVQLGALHGGTTTTQLANNFIASAEFAARYGAAPSDVAYVTALYTNVLGRIPDQGGFDVQVNALSHGTTRAQLLINFGESPENQAKVSADWLLT